MSEAELIQAMHEQRAPDLEYTPITAPLPELVRPAEVEALREEYSRLYIMWENAMQSLRAERARIAELEGRFADAQLEVTRERNNCAWIGERSKEQAARIAVLEARLSIVPVGAIRRYFEHSDAFRDVRNGKYDIDQGRLDCQWIADWLDAQQAEVMP